jgi:hypothetical protein
VKLRELTRGQIYVAETLAFKNDHYLTRERSENAIHRMFGRLLMLATWPTVNLLTRPQEGKESEAWLEKGEWWVFLYDEEWSYHWLIHEMAHVLQDDNEDEEHSPSWLLHYVYLLRQLKRTRAANNLLQALT